MTEAGSRVICDAGPLIHLDELGCFSLLHDFNEVLVPGQVWQEVTLGYQVHGTIGILIRAIRRGQRTREEILTVLRVLPTRSTLHVRAGLLQDVIARVEAEE